MDFEEEIASHLDWIERLAALISNEAVADDDLEEIAQHDHCALGHWIDSPEADAYRELDEFKALVESHNAFHLLGSQFIAALQSGNEQILFDKEEDFLHKSQQVVDHLKALQEISSK